MKNILGVIVSYLVIAIIILLAKVFERWGKEASRKFIHIMLCNWWFLAMYFFDNVIWAAIVPASFVVINWVSYQKNIIKVMERDEKQAEGLGTVYYAISLLVLVILTFGIIKKPEIGLIGILIMGYGDGLAAIVGRYVKSKEYKIGNTTKTLAGSLTMLLVTFVILAIYFRIIGMANGVMVALVLSILATIVEAVSIKGTDNLTVPLIISGILMCI